MISLAKASAFVSAELSIATHLRLASEAIDGAMNMRPDNHFAAYLAQQAVEQIVLSLALAEAVHVPRSQHHQLDWIVRQLPERNAERPTLAKLTWLEAFATTYRYPSPSGRMPGSADPDRIRDALASTRDLLRRRAVHFDVDLDPMSKKPASHARPPKSK